MFVPRPARPRRFAWPAFVALVALFVAVEVASHRKPKWTAGGRVERLSAARRSDDAAGRAGDLVLVGPGGESLTVGAVPNLAGHFPLFGALVDVGIGPADASDPLIWLRTVKAGAHDEIAAIDIREPQPFECANGAPGIRALGGVGVGYTGEVCAAEGGRFDLKSALQSLGDGESLADWLNVGSLPVVVDGDGSAWDMEHDTSFVAFARAGIAVLLTAPHAHVSRTFSHFGAETFPSPVLVRYGSDATVTRSLSVVRGDVLHALARLPNATRRLDVGFGPDRGGRVSIRRADGAEIAFGELVRGETRSVKLPPGLGAYAELRDDHGVVTDPHVELPPPGARASVEAAPTRAGTVSLAYRDEDGAPLPAHVLFKGLAGTRDPEPELAEARATPAGRSLYLLDGKTRVLLPPGRYRITASHGLAYSLSVKDVTVSAGETTSMDAVLRRVIDTNGWLSADFHLHAGPSPDSVVSLADRVGSLVCEGIDLAVATDHNHVTDYGPSVGELGVGPRLSTIPGVEITSAGTMWGHFNAFPLPLPKGAPEEGVPVYFGKRPGEMFASARELGARVLQVNHARMDPGIGYFDLAHLDAATGRADPVFAADFDVLEAYNGMWIETREKVRQGPVDVVGLARRGKMVATTGNSDSHKLLYEEAGFPRTWVHASREPVETRTERTIRALLARDTTVTSGPFVELSVEGQGIGTVVRPHDGAVHVKVRVSAPEWVPVEHVEVWRDDTVAERFDVTGPRGDGVRFERDLTIRVGNSDATILAWADAAEPLPDVVPYEHALSIGFTGAVYVDGNGDGSVTVPPHAE